MRWIDPDSTLRLQQQGADVVTVPPNAKGPFDKWDIDTDKTITILSSMGNQVQVGGFYRFDCNVTGRCIGTQHNAYSVRDSDGKVQVVYKSSIEKIEKIIR